MATIRDGRLHELRNKRGSGMMALAAISVLSYCCAFAVPQGAHLRVAESTIDAQTARNPGPMLKEPSFSNRASFVAAGALLAATTLSVDRLKSQKMYAEASETEAAPPKPKKVRITAFDAIRFFLIAYIVCGHFISFAAPGPFALKAISQINVVVGAFFALSGYVAAYTTTENAERAASPKLLNTWSRPWAAVRVASRSADLRAASTRCVSELEKNSRQKGKMVMKAMKGKKTPPSLTRSAKQGRKQDVKLERTSVAFKLRSGTMMSLQRTSSEAVTSAMTSDAFKAMAQRLGFSDLKEGELKRLYESIDANADGNVTFWEFARAVADGPVAHTLQNFVTRFRCGLDCGFDNLKFFGSFRKIRELRDYSYHVNYTKERQLWQDQAIKSVISRVVEQPAPWLVYTCGPMGVGKGYTLSWMSQHGFFPLENIVHIDPDAFKMMMPEWPDYVARDRDSAGTMCHMESSFMVEVAQAAAMEKRQNIWVDGSLRDAAFYEQVFRRIRQTHPHYRISIFYISASEHAIRQRIKVRAEQTGRDVPEHLIVASLQAMDKSLNTLTPLCDFVARINNEGHEPTLVAFETVDTKGNWRVISDRTYYDPSAFPQSKPTQRLSLLDGRFTSLITDSKQDKGAAFQQLTVSLDSLAEAKGVAEIPGLTR
eukprot:s2789_g5.t1